MITFGESNVMAQTQLVDICDNCEFCVGAWPWLVNAGCATFNMYFLERECHFSTYSQHIQSLQQTVQEIIWQTITFGESNMTSHYNLLYIVYTFVSMYWLKTGIDMLNNTVSFTSTYQTSNLILYFDVVCDWIQFFIWCNIVVIKAIEINKSELRWHSNCTND